MSADNDSDSFFSSAPRHWGTRFTKTIHHEPSALIDPAGVTLPPAYTVVITGAGKGIGEYIARAYVHAKATNLIITSRTQSDLETVKSDLEEIAKKQGRTITVVCCQCDAAEAEGYERIGKILTETFDGRLDCLILNAGGGDMTSVERPLHEREFSIFTKTTMLNYFGPYYGAMTLMPFLLDSKSQGKTLINIVSGAVHLLGMSPVPYNIAKLATTRMTEIMASHYAEQGLGCYAVHPGSAPTPGSLAAGPSIRHILIDDVGLAGAFCVWLSNKRPMWASGRYLAANWDVGELESMKEDIVAGDKLKFRMVV